MSHHLITKNFNVFSAEQFKESLTEPANTIVYLFYGRHQEWGGRHSNGAIINPVADDSTARIATTGTDDAPPVSENSLYETFYNVYDNMIGGKKVEDGDAIHMVKRYDWTSDTVYEMYDHSAVDLHGKAFYVHVALEDAHDVFKCIDNNYNAKSTQPPKKSETSANDEIYITTSDGYQWKYMYTIPDATWDKFATADFMPVVEDSNVATYAVEGALNAIKVTNEGTSYSSYANGYVLEYSVAGDNKLIAIAGTTGSIIQLNGNTAAFSKEEITTSFLDTILIADGGTNYTTNDELVVIGGDATLAATANITSVGSSGEITGISVLNRGKSYSSNPDTVAAAMTMSINTHAAIQSVYANGSFRETVTASSGGTANVLFSNSTVLYLANVSGTFANGDTLTGSVSGNATVTNTPFTSAGSSANLINRIISANAIIIDSNTTHITVTAGKGIINELDEITGTSTGTTANIAAVSYTGDSLSSNTDFYKGSSFYVAAGTGAGQISTIDEYIVTANQRRVLLATELSTALAADSQFEIGPQVVIQGDGTGAVARAIVRSTLNANTVANVHVINTGSGYTWADITIRGNTGFVTNAVTNSYITNTATASAILSPPGGHGSDVNNELFANRIGVSITISNTENGLLVSNNDFRQVGLLRDPLFANGTLTLSSSTTNFSANEKITGSTSNATAIVVTASSNEITMRDIRGFFQGGETVTGNVAGNSVISTATGGVDQPTSVFRQTHKYTANISYPGTAGQGFIQDELVTQENSLANGYLLSVLTAAEPNGEVEITNQRNVFLISDIVGGDKYIVGKDSAATAKLTGVEYPDIKDGSGEIIYIENIEPVDRTNNQAETYKLILEF